MGKDKKYKGIIEKNTFIKMDLGLVATTSIGGVNSVKHKVSLQLFESPLTKLGEAIDEYLNEISFDKIKSVDKENDKIIIKNEILSIMNKSKLNPDQFASLLVLNNVYIENEKMGDWTKLKINEIEETINNIRNEINYSDNKEESINYKTTIRQTFE